MINYQCGFGNQFVSECLPVILPGRNSPQKVPHGLYTEQLSGSAFAMVRAQNFRSWLYRILPSVCHGQFDAFSHKTFKGHFNDEISSLQQLRWDPYPLPKKPLDFIEGLFTLAGQGDSELQQGGAIHLYSCNRSMKDRFFFNADGESLFVPQQGKLLLKTEFGLLELSPSEIAIIPRGVKFQIELLDKQARGYFIENFGLPFRLPELGMMGANALANPRDFLYPCAWYEDKVGDFELIAKYRGGLWKSALKHSPLDVVAWYGNYAPYKYNLKLFNTINTVSFDHPDPCIFTVLHSPSEIPNFSNLDFVIFPERWMVAEDTFRPPYFHRNIMSEYMGLIEGTYDAKEEGFLPGGGSLHNCMSAHGPDVNAYEKAIKEKLKPEYYGNVLAFMLESRFVWHPTKQALNCNFIQKEYTQCWKGFKKYFKK